MSDFKLTFTLKQHTPIIHFQHDQHGATLRATEVKPKLDRFIIEHAFGGILNFDYYKKFLIGNISDIEDKLRKIDAKSDKSDEKKKNEKIKYLKEQKLAFDYKLRFKTENLLNKGIKEREKIPFFFGNMGNDYKYGDKFFSFTNKPILGEITTFKPTLKSIIKKYLSEFFTNYNFGTRQSKGYGSFTVEKIENDVIDNDLSKIFSYYFKLNLKNIEKLDSNEFYSVFKKAFEDTELFYRSLRSGINYYNRNRNNLYFKSALFMFLKSKGIQWDKKTLKAHYLDDKDITIEEAVRDKKNKKQFQSRINKIVYMNTQAGKYNNPDILTNPIFQDDEFSLKLWRDLFGLSSDESWYSYRAQITKDEVYKRNDGSYVKKKKENRKIDRLKSPILFKPIININKDKNEIVFYFDIKDKSYYDVLGTKMLISIKAKYNKFIDQRTKKTVTIKQKSDLILPFPDLKGTFNKVSFFENFFDYAFNMDVNNHIKLSNNYDKELRAMKSSLLNIYDQLKNK